MGYRVDVVDFVSSRHTDKNLMLRAQKAEVRNREALAGEYAQLKNAFRMTPALERYLFGDEIQRSDRYGAPVPFWYPTMGRDSAENPPVDSRKSFDLEDVHSLALPLQIAG